jgi:hypothetical protein
LFPQHVVVIKRRLGQKFRMKRLKKYQERRQRVFPIVGFLALIHPAVVVVIMIMMMVVRVVGVVEIVVMTAEVC